MRAHINIPKTLFFIVALLTYSAYPMNSGALCHIPDDVLDQIVTLIDFPTQIALSRNSKRLNKTVKKNWEKEFKVFTTNMLISLEPLKQAVISESQSDANRKKNFEKASSNIESTAALRLLSFIIAASHLQDSQLVLKKTWYLLRYTKQQGYACSKLFKIIAIENNIGNMNGSTWFESIPYVQDWPLTLAVQQQNITLIKLLLFYGFDPNDKDIKKNAKLIKNEKILRLLEDAAVLQKNENSSFFARLKNKLRKK